MLGLDEIGFGGMQCILGRGFAPAGQVFAPRRTTTAIQQMMLPNAIRSMGIQGVDKVQDRWFPIALAQGFYNRDVPAQAAMHGAAVGAEEDPTIDARPGGITSSTIAADFGLQAGFPPRHLDSVGNRGRGWIGMIQIRRRYK